MRILVTGGAGFIGSHVADAAIARGHEVLVIDDLSTGKRENVPSGARFVQLDIRNGQKVSELVGEFRPDVITHQAAQTSVSVSTREPVRDAEINILGSIQLCNAAVEHGVKRVVFASTGGAIYGEVPDGKLAKEGDPTTPLSPYACSKLAFENYLGGYYGHERGLKSTVLRYANVYGPRQDPHGEAGVIAIFSRRLKAKEPIQINAKRELGDGGCIRDYVFVADVVRANLAAINGEIDRPIMNVCTGEATSTKQLADALQAELGAGSEVKVGPRREGDLERSVLDRSYCNSIIGPATSLDEGLVQTARWFAAQK
ncbi:MAG: UDP-glucose 4-epimerase [Myxococcaceae bacterium]|nr:UDP-glucose 4-epimerase [Myxococcaceae bacterium]